tara:strand:+ start:5742 stop:6290 length:549 start_codon:yes stop_codon:yes gene_type:complete
MAIELGQASKPTRKQMQQKRVLERERRKAQNRANRTGESVRFGNETTTGMISPQEAAAPKPRANRAERQAARKARTQQKQKRAVKNQLSKFNARNQLAVDQVNKKQTPAAPTPQATPAPMPTPQYPPKPTMGPLINVSEKPMGSVMASMFSTGGVATKKAIGSNDYRKSGTTLSTVDNRKKK